MVHAASHPGSRVALQIYFPDTFTKVRDQLAKFSLQTTVFVARMVIFEVDAVPLDRRPAVVMW